MRNPRLQMSLLLSILFALQLGLGLGFLGFCFSVFGLSVTNGQKISHKALAEEASCPLNFNALEKLVRESAPRPAFLDMSTQCEYILQGIRLVRSEYLRTNGLFFPPPTTTEACLDSYKVLMSELVVGFDIESSCGYHPEWISEGCMNITSWWQFESLIPESKLQEVRHHCNQSLDSSQRSHCTNVLSSLGKCSNLHGGGQAEGTNSVCTAYPFMYAAALINPFGPTDIKTANCLFSLKFSSRESGIRHHKFVIAGVVIGCATGFLGASVVVWFLWMLHKKSEIKKSIPKKSDSDTNVVWEMGPLCGNPNLVKLTFLDIKQATRNFSRENIVGKGGYGNVYRGILSDGSEVAFKRFKNCSTFGEAAFALEVEVIASVRHANIVALRGYCTETVPMEGQQRIIVCDLMHNGSLYDHLF